MRADRRQFLRAAGGLIGGAAAPTLLPGCALGVAQRAAADRRSATELAADEDFWFEVRRAFRVDRSIVNLNNGGVSPACAPAQDALAAYDEYQNLAPAYTMWRHLRPQVEGVRARLAALFGCAPEEVAIVRNATEALVNALLGWPLERGDEVVTTEQDYFSMLEALDQRAAREGVVVRRVRLPCPAEDPSDLVRPFADAITPRTRLLLACHVINLTGQILPIRALADLAHGNGAALVVDGAHSFAHFPFERDDLACDAFGTSLHKWLNAPIGTGMLYVRRERIPEVFALFGQKGVGSPDVRKFEAFGTYPVSHRLAIAEAAVLHRSIGAERKVARLRFLRDRWVAAVRHHPRVRFLARPDTRNSGGFVSFAVEGEDPSELAGRLFQRHRILVTAIGHPAVSGIRVSPGIYTTSEEVDRFAEALLAEIGPA